MDLAQAAEMCNRTPGLMSTLPPAGQAAELVTRARALASGSAAVEARVLTAEAFRGWTRSPRSSWPAAS